MKSLTVRLSAIARVSFPALALLALTSSASAQWDAIARDALKPVVSDGFIVIHENAAGINAFSAASQKWTTVSVPGSSLVGFGDWTMLTKEPGGTYRGYSARRNASAAIAVINPVIALVSDDVALVIDADTTPPTAHGYSAVYNTWATIPLSFVPAAAEVTISRFVIALRDDTTYHGFAARTGAWAPFTVASRGDVPTSDGNTVLVDLLPPAGPGGLPAFAAFSGVRGIWTMSPFYDMPNMAMLDHNVAYTRVRTAFFGATAACAYSAYDATWTVSPILHDPALITESISDNVVLIEDLDPAMRFEAFGSRPAVWGLWPGNYALTVHDEDYAIIHHLANSDIVGYSGVCGGVWMPELTPSGAFSIPVGTPDHQISLREGTTLHTFEPAMNVWSPTIGVPAGSIITGEDCLTDVRGPGFRDNAGRWGTWTGGPPVPAAPFTIASGGSVVAHQQTAGAGIGDIYVFDERCDVWPAPFNPGSVPLVTAGRNVLVTNPGAAVGGTVFGYSVQRGDWTSPAPLVTPLATPQTTEENVAWFEDGANRVWAFGSPNVGHVYYAWPNGTEYHVSGFPTGGTVAPILGYSIKGTPGTTGAFALISSDKIAPTIFLPFLGFVCIDLTWFTNIGFFGVTDADCLRERLIGVPIPFGGCFQFWMQPLSFNFFTGFYTWEHRCDPAWFF